MNVTRVLSPMSGDSASRLSSPSANCAGRPYRWLVSLRATIAGIPAWLIHGHVGPHDVMMRTLSWSMTSSRRSTIT